MKTPQSRAARRPAVRSTRSRITKSRMAELPSPPRELALPPPKRWKALWRPLAVVLIIALAIAGALLFGAPNLLRKGSTQLNTNTTEKQAADTSLVAQIRYEYEWKGESLSSEAGDQQVASTPKAVVSEGDVRRVSAALGLGEEIRTSEYDAGVMAFEAGAVMPNEPLDATTDSVYSDPNAYQLTAYSNQSHYWYSLLSSGTWMQDHAAPLPDEAEAKTLAEAFFRDRNLLPSDAGGPYVRSAQELLASISAETASAPAFVSVYFTRLIDGREVVDESGTPLPYLTLDIGGDRKILSASGPFQINPSLEFSTAPGRSSQAAWDGVSGNEWGPGRYSGTGDATAAPVAISMDTLTLAMLAVPGSTADEREYFEAVYVFGGTLAASDGSDSYAFHIVAPAVTDGQYEAYLKDQDATTTEPIGSSESSSTEDDSDTTVEPY